MEVHTVGSGRRTDWQFTVPVGENMAWAP
jgi:hypothetical protein